MDDYSTEPRLHFKPISVERYSEFYSLEMDKEKDDINFYSTRLQSAHSILELGCGTGRISSFLAGNNHDVTGLDISPAMLMQARKKSNKAYFLEGDMRQFSFKRDFSHIIIPYNTINLLQNEKDIKACLTCTANHLSNRGQLLFQLFVPSTALREQVGERSFQFKIIPFPDGSKLIKETIRCYLSEEKITSLEERYRIRPAGRPELWEDLSHTITLHTPDLSWWKKILSGIGLSTIEICKAPDGGSYHEASDNSLFLVCSK